MGFKEKFKRRLRETLVGPPAHATKAAGQEQSPAPPPPVQTSASNLHPEPEPEPVSDLASEAPIEESSSAPPEAPPPPPPPPESQVRISTAQLLDSDYATDDAPVRNAHHAEIFETTLAAIPVRVTHSERGEELEFSCEPGEFVLDAAERAGLDLPYSCRSGGCLVCAARLTEGASEMGEQYVLEDEHEAAGFTLLCCTTVTSPCHFISHQEDEID